MVEDAPDPGKETDGRKRVTEGDMLDMLAVRYAPPSHVFLPHTSSATGAVSTRTADAIAMSIWPSRGLEILGFECKSQRSDWLRELREPEKADQIQRYVDRWWIVAPDGIVDPSELPANWGLLAVKAKRLVTVKQAPDLQPKEIGRPFLAAVMRRLCEDMIPVSSINGRIEDARKDAERRAEERYKSKIEQFEEEAKRIAEFERVSGIKVDRWDLGDVAEAVGVIRRCGTTGHEARLRHLRKAAENILKFIGDEMAALKIAGEGEVRDA